MTADLSALIARLEAAEVGSRELDAAVCMALGYVCPASKAPSQITIDPMDPHWAIYEDGGAECTDMFSSVTTSLDAALALAERVLEERGPININVCLAGSAQAQIYPVDPCGPHEQAVASTPALALCIAILRAKQGEV